MKTYKTKYLTMTGYIKYARIFHENYDDNMDYHSKTEGQFNCNFYFSDEDDIQRLMDTGIGPTSMGHDRIKEDGEFGIGKYIKLHRPFRHPKVARFGGAPVVVDHTNGESGKIWDFDADGALGHGTEVRVKISTWGEGSTAVIRLEKVAVINHVPYEVFEEEGAF